MPGLAFLIADGKQTQIFRALVEAKLRMIKVLASKVNVPTLKTPPPIPGLPSAWLRVTTVADSAQARGGIIVETAAQAGLPCPPRA